MAASALQIRYLEAFIAKHKKNPEWVKSVVALAIFREKVEVIEAEQAKANKKGKVAKAPPLQVPSEVAEACPALASWCTSAKDLWPEDYMKAFEQWPEHMYDLAFENFTSDTFPARVSKSVFEVEACIAMIAHHFGVEHDLEPSLDVVGSSDEAAKWDLWESDGMAGASSELSWRLSEGAERFFSSAVHTVVSKEMCNAHRLYLNIVQEVALSVNGSRNLQDAISYYATKGGLQNASALLPGGVDASRMVAAKAFEGVSFLVANGEEYIRMAAAWAAPMMQRLQKTK